MSKNVLFEYEGVKYYTYGDLADGFGLCEQTIRSRVTQLGWSMESALDLVGKYEVEGKSFKSLVEIAEYYDVSYGAFRSRYKKSGSLEVALGLVGKYEVEGKPFKSLVEVSEYYDVSYESFRSRYKKSGSLEVALGLVPDEDCVRGNNTSPIGVWFREKYYKSLSKLAKEYGVDRMQLYHRHMKLKWTLEQALLLEERPGVTYFVEGKMYVGIPNLAKAYGLSETTVTARYKVLNWTLEEALGIVERKTDRSKQKKYKFTYDGEEFTNLAKACRKLKINSRSVARCVKVKGMDVVEAIDYVKKNGGDLRKKSGRRGSGNVYVVGGKPYTSIRGVSDDHGVKEYSVVYRMSRYGMSVEEAIEDIKKNS